MCVVFVAAPPPKTLTKEWQEASNERAKELNLNPITGMYSTNYNILCRLISYMRLFSFLFLGISSEGYSGKGFVQAKK